IGYHSAGSAESNFGWLDAFRKGMAELGWSEAKHYVIDARYADGDVPAMVRNATELVATQPDIIVTVTDEPTLGRLTKTTPIVFALAGDPVASGYAASLQRPGGNATGLSALTPDLAAKRLQLLKDALPQMSHVAVLFQATDTVAVSQAKGYQAVADRLKVRLSLIEMNRASDIQGGLA